MDKDTEKYFETYFDLFASQGWKQFIEDMEAQQDLMSDIRQARDANDLYFRKGQLAILDNVVGLSQAMEIAWKDVQQDD